MSLVLPSDIKDKFEIRKLVNSLPPEKNVHYHFRKNGWIAKNNEFEQKLFKCDEFGFYDAHVLAIKWRDMQKVSFNYHGGIPSSVRHPPVEKRGHHLHAHPSKLAYMAASVECTHSYNRVNVEMKRESERKLKVQRIVKKQIPKFWISAKQKMRCKGSDIQMVAAPTYYSSLHRCTYGHQSNYNCINIFHCIEKRHKNRNCRDMSKIRRGLSNGEESCDIYEWLNSCLYLDDSQKLCFPSHLCKYIRRKTHGPSKERGSQLIREDKSLLGVQASQELGDEKLAAYDGGTDTRTSKIRQLNRVKFSNDYFVTFDPLPKCKGVNYHRYCQCWVAAWCERGKQLKKRFPVKRHGYIYGRRYAMEERKRKYEWKFCKGIDEVREEARNLMVLLAAQELFFLREAERFQQTSQAQNDTILIYKKAILLIVKDVYNISSTNFKYKSGNTEEKEATASLASNQKLPVKSDANELEQEVVSSNVEGDDKSKEAEGTYENLIYANDNSHVHESFVQSIKCISDAKMYLDLPFLRYCLENRVLPNRLPQSIQHGFLINLDLIAQLIEMMQLVEKRFENAHAL